MSVNSNEMMMIEGKDKWMRWVILKNIVCKIFLYESGLIIFINVLDD